MLQDLQLDAGGLALDMHHASKDLPLLLEVTECVKVRDYGHGST